MKEEIIKHINQLEKEKGISILLAAESGSRAWGCPSIDSDYDVRIIFKRPKSAYLQINEMPDTINYFHGELLDINGWDIKKTLRLIRKSNATPFEWSQSPIKYKDPNNFSKRILDFCKEYFQPKHSINHYKGIAKNSYLNNNLDDSIKLKKLFYVLRPLMAAKWIISKNEIPPMDIPNLISIIENNTVKKHIDELLEIKTGVNEDYIHKVDPLITKFIKDEFEFINSTKLADQNYDTDPTTLNKAFLEIIEE